MFVWIWIPWWKTTWDEASRFQGGTITWNVKTLQYVENKLHRTQCKNITQDNTDKQFTLKDILARTTLPHPSQPFYISPVFSHRQYSFNPGDFAVKICMYRWLDLLHCVGGSWWVRGLCWNCASLPSKTALVAWYRCYNVCSILPFPCA